ncbi:tripartite tricarboxylate transporter substrate binding protein [Azotobacter beijerinckii]|uniref:Tripartite-type tricarboxylate transporter, receptor component TctC n=1 Tax=Azotobacter beijerinckii TaxID=170623 RepID=A0A1I4AFZ7_9GAMM|nr:tripartite tricarboxylate transporter substrate binding protein [Azotobacter beijerinckii]SFA93879.1 Tripartite-type tricarboxylate transporter, receptor component TctC [Azotobacter beijerinckii]SFK54871.1 Tripartite-type tricarboxylate transporter, receptor component TctC [Azotobacter beijerinckii]
MQKRTFLLATLAAAVGLSLQGTAQASDYPNRPIELVVPNIATGSTDMAARAFAKYAEKRIGKPVVVVRISGAGGYNGSRAVREDKSSGYQVLYTHQGIIANYLTKVAPYSYDGFKVGPTVAEDATVGLYVSGKSGIKSIQDLLARARAEPGKLKAATEYGTYNHFMFLKLQKEQGVKFKMVESNGDAGRIPMLLSGTVDVIAKIYSGTQEYLKSGDFVLLGEPTGKRAPNAPEVPTYKEQGLDFTFPAYTFTLFFNQSTPQEIVDSWDKVAREVTSDPAYQKEVAELGMAWTYKSPQESAAAYASAQKLMAELVEGASPVAKQ